MKKIVVLIALSIFTQVGMAQTKKPAPKKKAPATHPRHPANVILSDPGTGASPTIDGSPSLPVDTDTSSSKVHLNVDQMPEFTGGISALSRYLSRNVKYPQEAIEQDIQGQVTVEFTVCEDGKLCDERVVRGIGRSCDNEALRVIKAMPAWKPGSLNGKPVKVRYRQSIKFKLQEEDPVPSENK